jgi:hypothetical protein
MNNNNRSRISSWSILSIFGIVLFSLWGVYIYYHKFSNGGFDTIPISYESPKIVTIVEVKNEDNQGVKNFQFAVHDRLKDLQKENTNEQIQQSVITTPIEEKNSNKVESPQVMTQVEMKPIVNNPVVAEHIPLVKPRDMRNKDVDIAKLPFSTSKDYNFIVGKNPTNGTKPIYGTHTGRDAIFALACNYKIDLYKFFVGSLRKFGYKDDIVLAVSPIQKMHPGVQQYVQDTNVVAYEFDVDCKGKDQCKLKDEFLG